MPSCWQHYSKSKTCRVRSFIFFSRVHLPLYFLHVHLAKCLTQNVSSINACQKDAMLRSNTQPHTVSKNKAKADWNDAKIEGQWEEIGDQCFFIPPKCGCTLRGLKSSWPEKTEGYWVQVSKISGRASMVGPVVRNLPSWGHGFDLCSRKIPHAGWQLSLCTTTTEPAL